MMQTPADINLHAEGGPAFPVSIPGCGDNGWHGMTLRDWFAGVAMQGMMANSEGAPSLVAEAKSPSKAIAGMAYMIADEMLAARVAITADKRTGE
jgi:hypothetical protein